MEKIPQVSNEGSVEDAGQEPHFDEDIGAWVVEGHDNEGRPVKRYYDEKNKVWVNRYPYDEVAEKTDRGVLHPKGNEQFNSRPDIVGNVYSNDDGNFRAFDPNS